MLVVSIVGIVAAGLTAGLVGVTSLVRRHVAEQERTTVQRAYTAMLRDQRVPPGRGCEGAATSGAPTNDMRALAGHRRPVPGDPAHRPVSLYPAYIARPATRYHYYCTGAGVIITADAP